MEVASAHPGALAVARGDQRLTYAELRCRAETLARAVAVAGVPRRQRIGILCGNPVDTIASVLASLRAGCSFVPLELRAPRVRLAELLKVTNPACLIADSEAREGIRELADAAPVLLAPDGLEAVDHPLADLDGLWQPDDACDVFFSSGTTGRPKAIVGRLSGIDHFVRWEAKTIGVGPGTSVSQLTSPGFDAFLRDVFTPLCFGGTVCIPPDPEIRTDPRRLSNWLEEAEVEVLHCIPSLFAGLSELAADPNRFSALRCVLLAGERLSRRAVGSWFSAFGERIQLVNLYGPTETTMTKLFHVVTPIDLERHSVPIGRAMPGARVLIVDEEDRPCGIGSVGEILIRTPFMALGYLDQPELTRQSFVPNPTSGLASDPVYRTGDLGRLLPDGSVEFVGRRDEQVKIRGVRVECGEVAVLLHERREVSEAGAVVVGERDTLRLCAFVVSAGPFDLDQLRRDLEQRLPPEAVPSQIVPLERLPRLDNGKVDVAALRELVRAAEVAEAEEAPPRTEWEFRLAALWSRLLGRPSVGIDRNFFAIGGHSLMAARMLAEVRTHSGTQVSLRAFFDSPTVEQLARLIESSKAEDASASIPRVDEGLEDCQLPDGRRLSDLSEEELDELIAQLDGRSTPGE